MIAWPKSNQQSIVFVFTEKEKGIGTQGGSFEKGTFIKNKKRSSAKNKRKTKNFLLLLSFKRTTSSSPFLFPQNHFLLTFFLSSRHASPPWHTANSRSPSLFATTTYFFPSASKTSIFFLSLLLHLQRPSSFPFTHHLKPQTYLQHSLNLHSVIPPPWNTPSFKPLHHYPLLLHNIHDLHSPSIHITIFHLANPTILTCNEQIVKNT